MNEFIALPNVEGDAFVLRRQSWLDGSRHTILVDGGRDPEALLAELAHVWRWRLGAAAPAGLHFDVVAVTHGDQDHTAGPLAVLGEIGSSKQYTWRVGEVWLPAAWSTLLHEMLPDPAKFLRDVLTTCRTRGPEVSAILQAFPAFHEESAEEDAGNQDEHQGRRDEGRHEGERNLAFTSIGSVESDQAPRSADAPRNGESEVSALLGDMELDDMALALVAGVDSLDAAAADAAVALKLASAVDEFSELAVNATLQTKRRPHSMARAASNIIRIAALAVRRGVRIRWFDIAPFLEGAPPSGGWENVLEPVNAVRVWPKRGGRVMVPAVAAQLAVGDAALNVLVRLAAASISPPNAFGLVFLAPPVATVHEAVLFCGDSHLSKPRRNVGPGTGRWPQPASLGSMNSGDVLVTAPHHGSPNNGAAYRVIDRWLGDAKPMFVRGTSSDVTSIAPGYLAAGSRRCTCCGRWDSAASRPVVAVSCQAWWIQRGWRWSALNRGQACTCP